MNFRMESDSIGTMLVPADAYYGIQSLRAKNNFFITGSPLHPAFIRNLAKIKKAAALTNYQAGLLSPTIKDGIIAACDEIADGKLAEEFITDAIQGGAGTSANMNANEVIANRAIELLHGTKGDYTIVHPNDHVNMSQSTNDVIPSAGKLTVLELLPGAIAELKRLERAFHKKSIEFDTVLKMGRTQLQDAVPMRLGQGFLAYQSVIRRDITRLEKALEEMHTLNMGATAIGTAINVSPYYLTHIVDTINTVCNTSCHQADNLFDATQNLDGFVTVSAALKTCAVNLSKICNDLRLLSSGPKTGIGEISLPAKQNGSSIMPGKVNPVIPEVVSQVAFRIIGNDTTITMAAEAGQLELNAFEPVIFMSLFESIECLKRGCATLTDNCVEGITANKERCKELVDASVGISTALCPYIGYAKSAELAKKALKTGRKLRDLVVEEGLLSAIELNTILDPLSMTSPSYLKEKTGSEE